MTPSEASELFEELGRQLRCWETEMWMRHAEHPVDDLYAAKCKLCRGSGRAHFCFNPTCKQEAESECLHPTTAELVRYQSMRDEFMIVHRQVLQEIEEASRGFLRGSLAIDRKQKGVN